MNGISLKTKLNSILTSIINCLPEGAVVKVVGVNGNGCLKLTDISSLGGNGGSVPQTLSIAGNQLTISQGNTITIPAIGTPITDVFTGLVTGNLITLTQTPNTGFHIMVFRNGQLKNPSEYTRIGTTVTFTQSFGVSSGAIGSEEVMVLYYV